MEESDIHRTGGYFYPVDRPSGSATGRDSSHTGKFHVGAILGIHHFSCGNPCN